MGDIIKKIDGVPVNVFDDLVRILDRHKVGDRVMVEVQRNGKSRKVSIQLEPLK
ncbi:MAG: PDZ domain-containing protein [Nitrospirales bacterium]